MSFPTPRLRTLALLLLALPGSGCRELPDLLDPTPRLDCPAPFPELGQDGLPEEKGPSGIEQALSRAGWPAEDSGQDPPGVPVAGRLVGELPETWHWLAGRDVTFGVHSPEDGRPPDALLYVEAFSSRSEARPTEELMRFELTVDPALLDRQLTWPADAISWVEAVGGSPRERDGMRRLAWMSRTRTGGRGFGYVSSPRAFAGWRWVGRNDRGVFLRLARSQGEWSGPRPLEPELAALLPRLTQRFPETSWLATAGATDPWTPGGAERAPAPAYMVFGTAVAAGSGVHLAMLCAREPACGPARDLAGLLESLRVPETGEIDQLLSRLESGSVESFASDLGFTLRDSSEP